jgi:hypothetical protein
MGSEPGYMNRRPRKAGLQEAADCRAIWPYLLLPAA